VIVSSAPLRISFSGGGSDYKQHYEVHGGAVFGSAINKRVYVLVNPLSKFSNESIRFTYRVTESVHSLESLKHPVVREALKIFNIKGNINIATLSDLPGNTGLGSSSAFTVALIMALAKYTKSDLSTNEVWQLAYKIERERFSGRLVEYRIICTQHLVRLRYYTFTKDNVTVSNDLMTDSLRKTFNSQALLVRIGEVRQSGIAASETLLSIQDPIKLLEIKESAAIASRSYDNFIKGNSDVEQFRVISDAINQNWKAKVKFQNTDSASVDERIKFLSSLGGIGFKLCGAGNSGFILALFDSLKPDSEITKNSESFALDSRGVEAFEI
jgi:D-glycero-alpha-D-manno-heptose-7-phosphate kinase